MTFLSRLRFLFGIIFVIALVGALVLYLNSIMSVAHSLRATLNADSTTIGTDYPGLVVKQNVEEGDKVKKDQTLFEIHSSQLIDGLSNKTIDANSLPFSLNHVTNDILLKANDDGVVEKINYHAGSFAPNGGILATINTIGSLYVTAHYRLASPDYARINKGELLDITLPDNSTQQATVFDISLVSNGNSVDTVVKARLKRADQSDFRFSVGTPVDATLRFNQKLWYQNVYEFVQQLFKPTTGQQR